MASHRRNPSGLTSRRIVQHLAALARHLPLMVGVETILSFFQAPAWVDLLAQALVVAYGKRRLPW
jgi:hypothetical protein